MPPAKAALQAEPDVAAREPMAPPYPHRLPNVKAGVDHHLTGLRSVQPQRSPRENSGIFQARVPAITGEATFRGHIPVDGLVSGQMNVGGSALTVKQRSRNAYVESTPELDGEIRFRDMLRINGHVAGAILSEKGTLIVDPSARVDAFIEVAVAIIGGTVNGDVIGTERVELGREATINGNISTPQLSMKPGATFQGDCRMLKSTG